MAVSFKDFKDEAKRREIKAKVNAKLQKGKDWVVKYKDEIVTITPIVIGGVATVVKVVNRRINLRKQEQLHDLYCYDRSLGHYWRLKRELSNNEWLEIDRRKKNGERLSDVLSDMKVLK